MNQEKAKKIFKTIREMMVESSQNYHMLRSRHDDITDSQVQSLFDAIVEQYVRQMEDRLIGPTVRMISSGEVDLRKYRIDKVMNNRIYNFIYNTVHSKPKSKDELEAFVYISEYMEDFAEILANDFIYAMNEGLYDFYISDDDFIYSSLKNMFDRFRPKTPSPSMLKHIRKLRVQKRG